jgi:nucleoside-diphosphate-sugar epimerase
MRVFVTGATGFIGFSVSQELIGAGHQVLGLSRSEAGAKALAGIGAQVHQGDLEDLESLRSGAAMADGVIHCAFNHDFSKFAANCEMDRQAIEVLGSAISGSGRPLVVSSGIGPLAPGRTATEEDMPPANPTQFPRVSEQTAVAVAARGIPTAVVRLPQVHDPIKQGFVSLLIAVARQKAVSAYLGDGSNRWCAVHRLDAARLYRLALEKAASDRNTEPARYHAVGEEGVAMKDIAEAIGRGLKAPVVSLPVDQAIPHFGFLGAFAGFDMPASSAITQRALGWHPAGPGLISDLDEKKF